MTVISEQSAAVATHAAAVIMHAAGIGLIEDRPDYGVKLLADLHPALAGFAGITPAADPGLPDVTDLLEEADGYKLGDLYQQLSTEARKGRALCQTPYYITHLLLDISFEHAAREWGPRLRMIDPACGTGHILIETLIRAHSQPWAWDMKPLRRVAAALRVVHGVDLDPYAVLVARYRLLAVAVTLLRDLGHEPTAREIADLPLHVAAADSLLNEAEPLLERGTYHVVVANPPYITVKDAKANAAIRARYPQVCNGKYSLALPFHALMTELLVPGGWCAQLTANSFMKREFGRRYVEEFLTSLDLRWVIDTSGVYIPGHGTPTVILVNRNQPPVGDTIATVRGIQGEPSAPADPAQGLVWKAVEQGVRRHEMKAATTGAIPAGGFLALAATASPQRTEVRPSVTAREPQGVDEPTLMQQKRRIGSAAVTTARVIAEQLDLFGEIAS